MTASSDPRPAPLPGYDLSPPTDADATAMLRRVFGPERGERLWADACRGAGLGAPPAETTAELARAAQALASVGGAAATVARSIDIRLRTFARLSARQPQTPMAST